jgi:hypothetical protein
MKDKLLKLTLVQVVLINSIVIIVFMKISSLVCPDGPYGGGCVKHFDNRVFMFQIIANLLFTGYYLFRIDRNKWVMLLLNLLLTSIIYIVAATLHSISKAGLF